MMTEKKKNRWSTFFVLALSFIAVALLAAGSIFGHDVYEDRKTAAELNTKIDALNSGQGISVSAEEEDIIQKENEIARLKNVIKEKDKTLKPAVENFWKTVKGLNRGVSTDQEEKRLGEIREEVDSGGVGADQIKKLAEDVDNLSDGLKDKESEYIEDSERSKLEDEVARKQEEQRKREAEEKEKDNNSSNNGNNNSDNNDNDDSTPEPPKEDAWLDDLTNILNSVGGSKYTLVKYDGKCDTSKGDTCSMKNGTIKVAKKVSKASHADQVFLMTYEVAHQRQFAVAERLNKSEEFAELFDKDMDKLATCMAVVNGAKSSEKFTTDQMNFAKTVWK